MSNVNSLPDILDPQKYNYSDANIFAGSKAHRSMAIGAILSGTLRLFVD